MFDACHVGVVLRAVLFVQLIAAIAAMFWSDTPVEWLFKMALLTGGTLPGTLFWLISGTPWI